jgi:membrane protease YdiL (CAAX protease family)
MPLGSFRAAPAVSDSDRMTPSPGEETPRGRFVPTEDFAELWLVLWICGGPFVATSILRLVQNHGATAVFDARRVVLLLGAEAMLAIGFLPYLRTRGWTLSRVTQRWEARDIGRALAIFLALWAVEYSLAYLKLFLGLPREGPAARVEGSNPWLLIVTLSVLDPFFEEFLFLGFAFNAIRRYGVVVAATAAICLRVAIHLYQGAGALAAQLAFAILLTTYYARTRRLWPIVLAHAITDLAAFGAVYLRGNV